jgi:hypothetical protein
MEKYFNIHNLVQVVVSSDNPSLMKDVLCQLSEFEVTADCSSKAVDLRIFDYSSKPKLRRPVAISKYYYYEDGVIDIPEEMFCANLIAPRIDVYCKYFALPVNFLIELVLVRKKHTLIHAAAVSLKGENYLFPAFGGVGKTTAIAGFIDGGGKLFGDDMIIVNSEELLGYPIDFSVYPYHLGVLPIKDENIIKKLKITKRLDEAIFFLGQTDLLLANFIKKVIQHFKIPLFNISPRVLFGINNIVMRGKPVRIFYLERLAAADKLAVNKINEDKLSIICADILFHEWHQSLRIMYAYCALSGFSMEALFQEIKLIYKELFTRYGCSVIAIPEAISDQEYQRELIARVTGNKCDEVE